MRLIIVSNRAPVNIIKENGTYRYEESPGGLASGLRAYIERMNEKKNSDMEIIWIGWPGAEVKDSDKEKVKNNPEYYYNRGVAKTKFGDNQGAIVDIKACVKLKPDHVKGREALVLLGVR